MPLASPPAHGDLMERLGVRPLPDALIEQALTHASFLNESGTEAVSNERLEFLGDAVLGMVIGHELFRQFPRRDGLHSVVRQLPQLLPVYRQSRKRFEWQSPLSRNILHDRRLLVT